MKHYYALITEKLSSLSLVTKLSVTITLALLLSLMVQGILISNNLSSLLERQIGHMGRSMTQQVANQLKEPILARDELTIEHIVSTLLADKNILGIMVYSDFVTLSRGINPKAAEVERRLGSNNDIYTWREGKKDAYITIYTAAISNDVQVGKIYITFSAELLSVAQQTRRVVVQMSTLLVAIIGLLVAYHISRIVTYPIYQLIRTSRAIAAGDYTTHFSPRRGDELGMLGDSLERMTESLIHKGYVEQTLSRYLSEKVARQVLSDGPAQDLGGKMRESSVLFADIAGFTALSEKMDAAAVNRLLNDYFSYIDIAAQIALGHVDKYMGDCAMLLFGVPEEDAEHGFHAIYAALLINGVVEQINQRRAQQGEAVALFRIGVNSGTMLAGNMGSPSRMEYTVIGDAVNLASRLCSSAAPGEILVASEIISREGLATKVCSEEYGPIEVKGKSKPVKVSRILGLNEELAQVMEQDIRAILARSEL